MMKIKKYDPWVVALPAASPSTEREIISSVNQHTLLTERVLSSCHSRFHMCIESSSAYLSNMTRSASLDKRTNPGVPSVRMNWIFSLCKQKKTSKISFANKAPTYTTATRKSTGYIIKPSGLCFCISETIFFPATPCLCEQENITTKKLICSAQRFSCCPHLFHAQAASGSTAIQPVKKINLKKISVLQVQASCVPEFKVGGWALWEDITILKVKCLKRYCLFFEPLYKCKPYITMDTCDFKSGVFVPHCIEEILALFLPLCLSQAHTFPPRPSLVTSVESMHPELWAR